MNTPSEQPSTAEASAANRYQFRGAVEIIRPFLALICVTLLFCVADRMKNGEKASFASPRSMRTVAAQTATVAVAALGMTVIVIAAGIDLSAGTAIALCATVLAWTLKEDVPTRLIGAEPLATVMKPLTTARTDLERVNKKIEDGEAKSLSADELRPLREQRDTLAADVRTLSIPYRRKALWTSIVAVVICIACGAVCGLANGFLVSFLRLVPFIVTLGTMQLYLGLAKLIASETTVRPDVGTQVPYWFADLLSVRPQALWLGVPVGIWVTLILAAILAAVLKYTVFGRYVFALGSNEATARLCGINVPWNKILIYTLSGVFVGIAGLYLFSRLTVGNPTSGLGLELKVIASVVIGGGSLNGGRGTVTGTLTGALIMSVITSGCTALGLTNPVQDMILGVIIVVAVTVDQFRQRRLAT
jgi:ribose/xylose/arabinose/galactoside ABC-type transport system permease subunit